jgi:hypothetical protein
VRKKVSNSREKSYPRGRGRKVKTLRARDAPETKAVSLRVSDGVAQFLTWHS